MVNLELYRVFREVARVGSFSETARCLFISQSAVSQAIGQLEGQLGHRLFVRSRRGVSLTLEGKVLHEHVDSALGILCNGEERLEQMRHLQVGELSIGAGDTISEHYLLPYLERFQSQYPGLRLRVTNRTSSEAIALLKSGRVDVAIANLPLKDPAVNVRECMSVHDIFVASDRYYSLLDKVIPLSELARQRLIMLEALSNSRRYVTEFFLRSGIHLEPEIELGAHDLLLEFARIGLGISCVIQEFSGQYLGGGRLFPLRLEQPIPPRAIGLCTLAGVSPSLAASRFIRLLFEDKP